MNLFPWGEDADMVNEQRHQFHMPDGPEQEERDRIFSSQLGKDEIDDSIPFPSRW